MNNAQAISAAIGCIRREIQRLAIPANLYELYGADSPHCIEASRQREKLRQALAVLEGLYERIGKNPGGHRIKR